jgi:alpha-L-rhamnosidase
MVGAALLANAAPVVATPSDWESYVEGPAQPFVTPVRVVTVSGDVWNPQALVSGNGTATLTRTQGGPAPTVLLDYGRDVGGVPHFESTAVSGKPTLHAAYSESLRWANESGDGATVFPPNRALDPKRTDDYPVSAPGPIDDGLLQGGERYQLLTLTTPGRITLRSTGIRFTAYRATPQRYQGWFLSSDDTLNRIWYAGAYTAQLNMVPAGSPDGGSAPVIFDGAKRDREMWSGDLAQTAPTILDSLGGNGSGYIRESLTRFGAHQMPVIGAIPGLGGSAGPMLPYSTSYSAYYVLDLAEYYLRTGDTEFVREQYPAVTKELGFDRAQIDPGSGLVSTGPTGLDWDPYDGAKSGGVTEFNALYYKALQDGAMLAEAAGYPDDAAAYRGQAARLREAINTRLFDHATGVYDIADIKRGPIAQDANATAVLFGVAPRNIAESILAVLQRLWTPHGTLPYSSDAGFQDTISPFIGGFEVQARLATGDTTGALALLRSEWGQMVTPGPQYTGALWENLKPDGQVTDGSTSLAHGWSTGPTSALSDYVLGVRPTAPGYHHWTLDPHPGDLTWARGQIPTPSGPIAVSWTRSGTRLTVTVTAPPDTTGTLGTQQTDIHSGTYTMPCP